jgi:lysophospholipase L1-like esterase
MKHHFILFTAALLLSPLAALHAADPITLSVDSPAIVFSPGNWTGDSGRSGKLFRQSWNAGAYFRVTWETTNAKPTAKLLLDTSTFPPGFNGPQIAYCIDGVWKSKIPCANEILIEDLQRDGPHELCVVLQSSQQKERWGSAGKSGLNVLRVTGLQFDAESHPVPNPPAAKWAMIIGDSITEGIGATELSPYSQLIGQALQTQGYEYGINACGWSGWINRGDNPPGDVPGYYVITHSTNGTGGQYDDAASRWNKIDGNNHSLLDPQGHLSADGQPGHEPALILIKYGTNDALHKSNPSDTQASIIQSLAALRQSAPDAHIILLIPFGQYYAKELKQAVAAHQQSHPAEKKLAIIDLGPGVARSLAVKNGVLGGLHPNDRGHALFAAKIIPQVLEILGGGK